ncbi:CAP domain-containing protein [Companilactobacillus ginsenosidimutans]|uniref:SCP domain-containing protein n=1 Tax=Companilactobacillus ginsenosidimutans TaxID=1007676 RepID=A0A0H4QHK0_9LACO|nr:CAP domain-containing protein [Companilactobacillus ginsenosidimutans]AKP67417.1 hypothetical protein ABM34_07630 [Companilactobacillus ginsenosidimutans]
MKLAKPLLVTALLGLGITTVVSSPVLSELSGVQTSEVKADANTDSAIGAAAFNEMNRLRTQNGLSALSWDGDLQTIANNRLNTLLSMHYLDYHAGLNPDVYPDRYNYFTRTEIIGFHGAGTSMDNMDINQKGQQIIKDYYIDNGNPTFGHRKTMLSRFEDHAAFAAAYDDQGTIFHVCVFGGTQATFDAQGGDSAWSVWTKQYNNPGIAGVSQDHYDVVDGSNTNSTGNAENLYDKGTDSQYGYHYLSLMNNGQMGTIVIKNSVAPLYTYQGTKVMNRGVAPGSGWATDRYITIDGTTYYRVSTNEFVKESDVLG